MVSQEDVKHQEEIISALEKHMVTVHQIATKNTWDRFVNNSSVSIIPLCKVNSYDFHHMNFEKIYVIVGHTTLTQFLNDLMALSSICMKGK
jgi:hypothetical protein